MIESEIPMSLRFSDEGKGPKSSAYSLEEEGVNQNHTFYLKGDKKEYTLRPV